MNAADAILKKALVGSRLDSAGWGTIQAGLRDRAFFSSTVEEVRRLDALRRGVVSWTRGESSASDLRQGLRRYLVDSGYAPKDGEAGTIKDLTSKARLDVILKHNAATARGYVNYLDGNTPGAFAAFPCQEFLRTQRRNIERKTWPQRWNEAGGKFYLGRMIAPKGDPVWTRLSVFGHPYPPFDWGSGMGVEDVSRSEALALGVITDDEIKARRDALAETERKGDLPRMTDGMCETIPDLRRDSLCGKILEREFGDQIDISNSKVNWQGRLIQDVREGKRDKARLGMASKTTLAKMADVMPEEDVAAFASMVPTFNRNVFEEHAKKHVGDNEKRLSDNIPLLPGDFDLMPTVWRSPDRVIKVKDHHAVLELEAVDGGFLQLAVNTMRGFASYYKTKKPLGASSGNAPGIP